MSFDFSGFPGDDRRAVFATLQQAVLRIQQQLALELAGGPGFGRVALVALLDEDGADALLEERDPVFRRCTSQCGTRKQRDQAQVISECELFGRNVGTKLASPGCNANRRRH